MHWLMQNGADPEHDAMLYAPVQVLSSVGRIELASYGIDFGLGVAIQRQIPLIEIRRKASEPGDLTDNLVVMGASGPVFNDKLRRELARLGITAIQYFPCVVIDELSGVRHEGWQMANITRKIDCLDLRRSELKRKPDGSIRFIDRLGIDAARVGREDLLRIGEYTDLILVADRVKVALEAAGVSGLRFFTPEEFNL